jgi:DNA-binding NarL/FixJ family response regulator
VTGIVVKDILSAENTSSGGGLSVLTARETEVLRLMAEGVCTKAIACHLNIGTKTVETHQFRMKKKLGISNVAGLTRFAIREGLIGADEMPSPL